MQSFADIPLLYIIVVHTELRGFVCLKKSGQFQKMVLVAMSETFTGS